MFQLQVSYVWDPPQTDADINEAEGILKAVKIETRSVKQNAPNLHFIYSSFQWALLLVFICYFHQCL